MLRDLKIRAFRAVNRLFAKLGYDLVPRDYYSPVPNLDLLPPGQFDRKVPMPGVQWNEDSQLAYLEKLAPHIAEFPYPRKDPGTGGFFLDNGNYESVDAEVLWAIIRLEAPKQVLELGSGYSTLVLAGATEANNADGEPAELCSCDPYARPFVVEATAGRSKFEKVSAIDIPIERFDELGSGDVLFVDTTHTVKTGSEVNRIVLEILPRLGPGVIVHFHDIYLPYEYPEDNLREHWWFWAEQYLLHAFLVGNPDWEVLFASNAIATDHPDRTKSAIPSFERGWQPGSFWIRRVR